MVMIVNISSSVRFHILEWSIVVILDVGLESEVISDQRNFEGRDSIFYQSGCVIGECCDQFYFISRGQGEALPVK